MSPILQVYQFAISLTIEVIFPVVHFGILDITLTFIQFSVPVTHFRNFLVPPVLLPPANLGLYYFITGSLRQPHIWSLW